MDVQIYIDAKKRLANEHAALVCAPRTDMAQYVNDLNRNLQSVRTLDMEFISANDQTLFTVPVVFTAEPGMWTSDFRRLSGLAVEKDLCDRYLWKLETYYQDSGVGIFGQISAKSEFYNYTTIGKDTKIRLIATGGLQHYDDKGKIVAEYYPFTDVEYMRGNTCPHPRELFAALRAAGIDCVVKEPIGYTDSTLTVWFRA